MVDSWYSPAQARIIIDPSVFDDMYIPPTLPHRMKHADLLLRLYWRGLQNSSSLNYITVIAGTEGRVGIGKTTLARYIGGRLEAEARKYGFNLRFIHLNLFGAPSLRSIIVNILTTVIHSIREESLRGFSVDELLKFLVNLLEEKNIYLLVGFDEFQNMLYAGRERDLYRLFRIYEEVPSRNVGRVGFIIVVYDKVRDMAAFRRLLPQVESQLSMVVELNAYTSQELFDILLQRAELGLEHGTVGDAELGLIAETIGVDQGGDGSARRAIKALHKAAVIAESRGHSRVLEEDVREALGQESPFRLSESELAGLSVHQLLILKAVAQLILDQGGGWVTREEVQKRYEELAVEIGERPRAKTQVHEYIRRLVNMGLLERRHAGRGRLHVYRLVGEIEAGILVRKIDELLGA